MMFCQGIGPWQAHITVEKQKAGYRTDEYTVRVILMRLRLQVYSHSSKNMFIHQLFVVVVTYKTHFLKLFITENVF